MIHKLTIELSELGEVQVIKNKFVFTLLMTGNVNPMKALGIVNRYVNDKPIIEVVKNDSNFLLIVLKPEAK